MPKIIHLLVDIASKNGNLLLNIAPSPQGDFHPEAYTRLAEIGKWMDVNGEAIYGTLGDNKIGKQGKMEFTHKGNTTYAIYRADEGEKMPKVLEINKLNLDKKAKITLIGSSETLKWSDNNGKITIEIPFSINTQKLVDYAWVFKISQ